jgi:hypothetical protein
MVVCKDPNPGPPFLSRVPHVHEMLLSRTLTGNQVLFSRADYDMPNYGTVNPQSHFQTSQFTHGGMMLTAPDNDAAKSALDFYSDVLGLKKTRVEKFEHGPGTEGMFDATDGTRSNLPSVVP